MSITKKNQQFARSCGLRPSSKELAYEILRKCDRYKSTEKLIDLREFNREIGRDRPKGEYDRKTIKEALAQLDESTYGWFTILKSHTWALHTVLVRPVEYAQNKKSQSLGKAPKLIRGNPMYSEQYKKLVDEQQQQDISKLDNLLSKLGLKYTPDNLARIWRLTGRSWSEIAKAIEYMLHANSTQTDGVRNPQGFLMESLKCGWHKGFGLMYEGAVKLPYFSYGQQIADYVDNLVKPDNPMCTT